MISVMTNRFEENRSNESVRDTKVRVSATSISNAAVAAADDFEAKRVSMEVEDSRVLNEESKVSETRVKDVKEEGEGGSSAKSGRVKSEQKGKTALVSSKKADARKGKSEAIVSEYDLMLSKFDDFAGSGKCWSVGYGFEMGDMVWGKVKSHPWWPGHIYNEAFATPSVRRSKREDCILVAFYGDSSYGWFDPDDLVHFEPTFAEKYLQTHVKNFIKAVEEGVDEVGRRSALGLVCHCRKKYRLRAVSVNGFFAVDFSDLERNCTYSASQIKKARERFQPKETLDFVKKLALKPRSKVRQDLDFVKKKATTLAFRKAAFEEDDPTYAEAFGIVPSKQPEEVAQPFRKPSSREEKCRDKKYRLAKAREWRACDLDQVKCVKVEDVKVLVDDALIRRRWQYYFHRILNDEGNKSLVLDDLEHLERCHNYSYCRHIKVEEVKGAIRRMHRGGVIWPNEF
ncbi:putative WD repeat domain phosphoinositide-interacting protein 3-like [Capsicum annuum]|nr:putative WD repeat domain phosphoinositide-interacting protein 3-like [Capsicum annuum]